MSVATNTIRTIAIAGGGIVAWSCAAALRRQLDRIEITVVAGDVPPDALADHSPTTLPSVSAFHQDIGLSDANALVRAGSCFRLGTLFSGWSPDDYTHVYGRYGQPFGTASFHQHWVRAAHNGTAAPYDAHAPAAAIARAGRFRFPDTDPASPLAGFEFGLTIDPPRYRAMMRAYALHLGASEASGEIADVRLDGASGFVDRLILADGRTVHADLFIDCTGPAGRVRGKLDQTFLDWDRWLPCDRMLVAETPPLAEPPLLDRVMANGTGWAWTSGGLARTTRGLAYASRFVADDQAAQNHGLSPATAPIRLRPGRRPQPWLRNCVAIGDAAIALDPLEWTNLHLAHSAIDRLIAMMPGRDCAPIELAEYNRQTANEADRVRDFLALHYRTTGRGEPMWRELAEQAPPDSLAHTLSLFSERGRLPFYEEETFSRDSWLAVLLGQNVMPRRTDPLIDTILPDESDRAMASMRAGIAAIVPAVPTHAAFLTHLHRQIAR